MRYTIFLLGLLALLVACQPADTHDHMDGHSHGDAIEITDHNVLPTLMLTAEEDHAGGHNIRIRTTNFKFAPEHASQEHIAGEGHAHIYVDGEKVGRVYGGWYHVSGLEPGEHEVRVNLNANSHQPFTHDGEEIDAVTTITVSDDAGHTHTETVEAREDTRISMQVQEDPESGYNIRFFTQAFELTPENVNEENVDGEGHIHLYVNDVKVARVYTEWFHIGALDEGQHEIRATLNTNQHEQLTLDGEPLQAVQVITLHDGAMHS